MASPEPLQTLALGLTELLGICAHPWQRIEKPETEAKPPPVLFEGPVFAGAPFIENRAWWAARQT